MMDTPPSSQSPLSSLFPRGVWAALFIFLVSAAASVWGWRFALHHEQETARQRFDLQSGQVLGAIGERMRAYEQALRGAAGLLVASRNQVNREVWRSYVSTLNVDLNYPGIQGVGFSLYVPALDKEAHLRQLHAEGFGDYLVKPDGERPEYTAIIYIEPFSGRNLRAFGYDMFSEPVRRAAMSEARDSGETVISGKLRLLQETNRDVQAGFIMYLPVYRAGLPHDTAEQRRAALFGYVYGPFRMKDLMGGILGQMESNLDLEIFDGDQTATSALMYDSDNSSREHKHGDSPLFSSTTVIRIGNHPWTVLVRSRPGFEASGGTPHPDAILAFGLLTSLLLFSIAMSLATLRGRALRLATEMTGALRESEETYREMFQNNQSIKLLIDQDSGRIEDANPAAGEFYGYPVEQLKQMRISDINTLPPDRIKQEMKLAAEQKRLYFNFRHRLASGEVRDVEVYSGPITLHGRKLLFSIIHDITERKRTGEALRESEARLKEITSSLAEGVYVIDQEEKIIFSNPEAQRLLGWGAREMLGADAHALFHHRTPDGTPCPAGSCVVLNALRSGQLVRELETVFWCKDGSALPVVLNAAPILRQDQAVGAVVAFHDIRPRLAIQNELRETLEEQRAILENTTAGIAYLHERRFIWFNARLERMFGYGARELKGQSTEMLYANRQDFEQVGRDSQASLARGENYAIELRMKRKDGTLFWCELSGKAVDAAGHKGGSIWIVDDITERRQAGETAAARSAELRDANQRLTTWARDLEMRNTGMALLNTLGDHLQSCNTLEEAYPVIAKYLGEMFPQDAGAVYIYGKVEGVLEATAWWGSAAFQEPALGHDECWALRTGHPYRVCQAHPGQRCAHVSARVADSLCIPLTAQGRILGVFHLASGKDNCVESASQDEFRQRFATSAADRIALALANLELRQTLQDLSIHDPLTGLFNRRHMETVLHRELLRAERKDQPLSVLMLDLDLFKQFNDSFGHDAGDQLLRELGGLLRRVFRESDSACRYGGEEFVVILPETPIAVARERAEELRREIGQISVTHGERQLEKVTVSIGIAAFPLHAASGGMLLVAADRALYQAKGGGRNQVCVAGDVADTAP